MPTEDETRTEAERRAREYDREFDSDYSTYYVAERAYEDGFIAGAEWERGRWQVLLEEAQHVVDVRLNGPAPHNTAGAQDTVIAHLWKVVRSLQEEGGAAEAVT